MVELDAIRGGEFGRTPYSEVAKGRDHRSLGFSRWLAGGGVKGGFVHGATDELEMQAVKDWMHVDDLHATILHLMGLNHERLTYRCSGRDFRLTDASGRVARGSWRERQFEGEVVFQRVKEPLKGNESHTNWPAQPGNSRLADELLRFRGTSRSVDLLGTQSPALGLEDLGSFESQGLNDTGRDFNRPKTFQCGRRNDQR